MMTARYQAGVFAVARNWQAVIDDSQSEAGVFVLGGYIATADAWEAFSKEWETLLPYALSDTRTGKRRFKMAEMSKTPERIMHLPAFYRVIEKYISASVSAKIDKNDLRRAQRRLFVQNTDIDWGTYADPYYVTFRCLMDTLHSKKVIQSELLKGNDNLDFIFDEHSSKKNILDNWSEFVENRPNIYGKNSNPPIFKRDEDFLPLQAADFWAWWVRKWYLEGTPERVQKPHFGTFGPLGQRRYLRIAITFDEDQLFSVLFGKVRNIVDSKKKIFDLRDLDHK